MVPFGAVGELCIGGDGVTRGYHNRKKITDKQFIKVDFTEEKIYRTGDLARWLPNGELECLGRIDHQVKINGHRIELQEIEKKIKDIPDIKEIVVVDKNHKDKKILCAYYSSNKNIDLKMFREILLQNLPDYMIPSYFKRLKELPKTPNGKIDRKALPEPEGKINTGTEYVAPTNETEKKLVKIWQEVLGIKKIGINDNFFDLGGDSLKAIEIATKLYQSNITIQLIRFINHPTIKEVADRVKVEKKGKFNKKGTVILPIHEGDKNKKPFFFGPPVKNFAKYFDKKQTLYGISAGFDANKHGINSTNRSEYAKEFLQEIKKIQPKGPYYLGGFCGYGIIIYEVAKMLIEQNEEVVYLGLVETPVNLKDTKRYHGRVDLFLAKDSDFIIWGWDKLNIGDLKIHKVSGNHTVISGDHIKELAIMLQKYLNEAIKRYEN